MTSAVLMVACDQVRQQCRGDRIAQDVRPDLANALRGPNCRSCWDCLRRLLDRELPQVVASFVPVEQIVRGTLERPAYRPGEDL
jgi:hypothetical protein